MRKLSIFLCLVVVCFLLQTTETKAFAMSNGFGSLFSTSPLATAEIKIRREKDNKIIASSNGGNFVYPNDRVKRGEFYLIELHYELFNPSYAFLIGSIRVASRNPACNFSSCNAQNIIPLTYLPVGQGVLPAFRHKVVDDARFSDVMISSDLLPVDVDPNLRLPIGSY
jgi:hypothetical protein